MRIVGSIFGCMVVAVALAATPGAAAHWPVAGGDAGRSGFQPVDEGGLPAQFLYSRTGLADRDVRTSIITSSGIPSTQRIIYGTDDGVVHLRILLTGAPVGPAGGVAVSASADPFGGGSGSAGFVETSTSDGLGQVFVVHNERFLGDPPPVGLQIAQIDEATGDLVAEVNVVDSSDYRLQSSAIITAPDAGGVRHLFFVAEQRTGTAQQLFKVTISNGSAREAVIGAAVRTPDIEANVTASPSLVWLNNASGVPTAYVAVPTLNGLRTFAVADLSAGPLNTDVGEAVRTPTTPVTRSGVAPGAAGSGLSTTPAIYATSSGPDGTRLHRFSQTGNSQVLTVANSAPLPGEAAPGVMTDQIVAAGSTPAGSVLVTTSKNLYSVRTSDLGVEAKYAAADDLVGGSTGFRFTTAVGTGALVFVVTDGGQQLALENETLAPVAPELFTPPAAANGSLTSFGQPSISRRFLQMATDRGLFVYGLRQASPPVGYWLAASDGGIFAFGDVGYFGSTGAMTLNKPIVAMAPTPAREGYWLTASDGGIFAFGDASFFGSTGDLVLNKPVVGMVPTRTGLGYWLVASDGGIFSFGDAVFYGSTGDLVLNKPIVGMAATPTGDGYWLVASDGGIFAFGDAAFLGSTGDIVLNKPIVGMAPLPSGPGYWLVASDGGVFSFGKAGFFGSTGDIKLNSPIVAMAPSATGQGYLFTAADGGVFVFGDSPFFGSTGDLKLNKPVVTIAAKP